MMTSGSCSSSGIDIQEFSQDTSVSKEIMILETDINMAMSEQVNVLSPNNFKVAQKSLEEAKRSIDNHNETRDALHKIALGHAYLKRAYKIANIAHSNIEDVLVARRQAINAGAPVFFPNNFQKIDNLLKNITLGLENDNSERSPENRTTLKEIYLELELDAVKHVYLSRSRETIVKAINDGAKTLAPESLAIAVKNFRETFAYITEHRHDLNQITKLSQTVSQNADQVMQLTRVALENTKNRNSDERYAYLDQININQSALKRDENDLFEKARREFTNDEAQVYKQGNTLTIRLRGLEFPSSKALLKGQDFLLLGKLQRVIKDFGNSSVIVEGHTDSIGNSRINEKISYDRAQTVRDYLLSIDVLPPDKISVIGAGYLKPIATNKTALGRAENRRVDVIIKVLR
jgi:outer membrane protein OmpA-like peptidoglycan-associated protein